MDQPAMERPRYVSSNTEHELNRYETDAYRERTHEENKRAHSDRLADMRMRAVEQSFGMLNRTAGTYDLSEVFRVADEIVEYTRKGA